ncbi:WRAP53 [Cordylochernes scorpioides]|uniref:WD repeat-containing protein 79 n=1 Tax=Cordylochernes scorpioides TaxID=51811 RepID=A0ABY6KBR9_9ARAC|nr:WRAP53 [Cordylochernes scorpioides]
MDPPVSPEDLPEAPKDPPVASENPPATPEGTDCQDQPAQNSSGAAESYYQADYFYDWTSPSPLQVTGAWSCFEKSGVKPNNFVKGCKWAPDGACLLTNSEDATLRIFAVPPSLWSLQLDWQEMTELQPLVAVKERAFVNDFAWYPGMTSQEPVTCCFAVCCKDTPIHLWNAFNGELQATYQAINHVEEVKGAHSLAFEPMGNLLYTGFNKMVRLFDVSRPGRQVENRPTHTKKEGGQAGIISCFAFEATHHSVYAAGSYGRTIGIYGMKEGDYICEMEGHRGGVTHVKFSPCGNRLYSGARMDNEILCWDLRNPGVVLARMRRVVATHQRMYFEVSSSGRWLVTGNSNGVVSVWDMEQEPQTEILLPAQFFQAHGDCVVGVALHPSLPLLATGSGQRHFPQLAEEDDATLFKPPSCGDCSIRLWWLQPANSRDSIEQTIQPSPDQPTSDHSPQQTPVQQPPHSTPVQSPNSALFLPSSEDQPPSPMNS